MMEEISSIIKNFEDAEIYFTKEIHRSVEVDDNNVVSASSGEEIGIAVRVVRDKRIGLASSTVSVDKLKDTVVYLYEIAQKVARSSPETPWWEGFPSSTCSPVPGLYSEEVAEKDLTFLNDLAKSTISLIPDGYSLSASFEVNVEEWGLVNTEGTEYFERVSEISLGIALAKKEGGYMSKSVYDTISSHSKIPIPEDVIQNLMEYAKKLKIRPKKVSGERVLYLHPVAVSQLLDFISEMFTADSIAKGESPIANKLGEEVFSDIITLSDNPLLPGGPASHGCDEEGVRGKAKVLVDGGVVKDVLPNLYWGYKLGVGGGRGYRPTYQSPPQPSYTNLTLHAGTSSPEGIEVLGLTGLHTASSETGYMSVVLSPAFDGDEHVEATLSVNVLELFGDKLIGVGKEGRWVGEIFTPGVIVRGHLS